MCVLRVCLFACEIDCVVACVCLVGCVCVCLVVWLSDCVFVWLCVCVCVCVFGCLLACRCAWLFAWCVLLCVVGLCGGCLRARAFAYLLAWFGFAWLIVCPCVRVFVCVYACLNVGLVGSVRVCLFVIMFVCVCANGLRVCLVACRYVYVSVVCDCFVCFVCFVCSRGGLCVCLPVYLFGLV